MAEMLVFMEWTLGGKGVLAGMADGSVRKIESADHARHPRHVLWSFVPTGQGDWGMIVNHRYAKALICDDGRITLGVPSASNRVETAWWKLVPHGLAGHVALVPYYQQTQALETAAFNQPVSLGPLGELAAENQGWYPRPVATLPFVPLPSFDDAAIDGTLYNFEVVTNGTDVNNQRLYLTIEKEHGYESPLTIGTDPKATAAQFRLVRAGSGRIISDKNPLVTTGRATEERVSALAGGQSREVEMINLSGSRTFASGDRVALRTDSLYYVGWKKDSRDLNVKAWTPGPNETFTIEKIDGTNKVVPGEIRKGDSFALLAGNGSHLSDDRGAVASRPVTAGAPHIDKWETFVLGEPAVRVFRIYGQKTGYPLTLGAPKNAITPLVQRYGRNLEQFEIIDRGHGMITLRNGTGSRSTEVVPGTDAGIEPGRAVGLRVGSPVPGIFFRLQVAPPAAWWPDARPEDVDMNKYRDPPEDILRTLVGAAAGMGGALISSSTGIPGGAAVFTAAFDRIFPAAKVSMYDLFTKFRADIRHDMQNEIAAQALVQAKTALNLAREQYVVTYLDSRRLHVDGGDGLAQTKSYAITTAPKYDATFAFMALDKDDSGKIRETTKNIALIRGGLPAYAICVAEQINVYQEIALLHAYQPNLVLPDVWLRTGDRHITATPVDGVRSAVTTDKLTRAMRVLSRDGKKPLKHGDKVILRSPASTNITAVDGGGGALEAKAPSNQIGTSAVFTIERVIGSAAGEVISNGDTIALRAPNQRHYVTAPAGGGALTATGTSRGAAESFTIEIAEPKAPAGLPAAGLRGEVTYAEHVGRLRTFAQKRYDEVRDMFEFLLNDRVSRKVITWGREEWAKGNGFGPSEHYAALFVRDGFSNIEVDRLFTDEVTHEPTKPVGYHDPENDVRTQWAIDGYREHMRRLYYYAKYSYFFSLRPLITIADDTMKVCEQLSRDSLLATEFSYSARTLLKHDA